MVAVVVDKSLQVVILSYSTSGQWWSVVVGGRVVESKTEVEVAKSRHVLSKHVLSLAILGNLGRPPYF